MHAFFLVVVKYAHPPDTVPMEYINASLPHFFDSSADRLGSLHAEVRHAMKALAHAPLGSVQSIKHE